MTNNFFVLRETAKFISGRISGMLIASVFSQEKNKLHVQLAGEVDDNEITLEFCIEKGFNYLIARDRFSKAKKNFATIFKDLPGVRVLNASVFGNDRAISFKLDNGYELVFTFFSAKANCFLVRDNVVLSSFKNSSYNSGKSIEEFIALRVVHEPVAEAGITVREFVRKNFRVLGEPYTDELLFRCGESKDRITDEKLCEVICSGFNTLMHEFENPVYNLCRKDNEFAMSLVKLRHLGSSDCEEFPDVNSLSAEYIKLKHRSQSAESSGGGIPDSDAEKLGRIKKKISSIGIQLGRTSESEKYKAMGEAILRNLHSVSKGDADLTAEDKIFGMLEIKLKKNLTPAENAELYFEKYKSMKNSVDSLESKLKMLTEERNKLEESMKENTSDTSSARGRTISDRKASKPDETSKFRKFELGERFELWVGKDSASNDLLTTRYAAPDDLWFHARGASGSHAVLKKRNKKEEPGKEVIRKAACIAAYYSKARNASSVPVAYCEKKYVKKKKGFSQGTVIMEREKVVFVKPGLPENLGI